MSVRKVFTMGRFHRHEDGAGTAHSHDHEGDHDHTDKHGDDYTRVHGLSINTTMKIVPIPPAFDTAFEGKYTDLAFAIAGHWAEFVDWTNAIWAKDPLTDSISK